MASMFPPQSTTTTQSTANYLAMFGQGQQPQQQVGILNPMGMFAAPAPVVAQQPQQQPQVAVAPVVAAVVNQPAQAASGFGFANLVPAAFAGLFGMQAPAAQQQMVPFQQPSGQVVQFQFQQPQQAASQQMIPFQQAVASQQAASFQQAGQLTPQQFQLQQAAIANKSFTRNFHTLKPTSPKYTMEQAIVAGLSMKNIPTDLVTLSIALNLRVGANVLPDEFNRANSGDYAGAGGAPTPYPVQHAASLQAYAANNNIGIIVVNPLTTSIGTTIDTKKGIYYGPANGQVNATLYVAEFPHDIPVSQNPAQGPRPAVKYEYALIMDMPGNELLPVGHNYDAEPSKYALYELEVDPTIVGRDLNKLSNLTPLEHAQLIALKDPSKADKATQEILQEYIAVTTEIDLLTNQLNFDAAYLRHNRPVPAPPGAPGSVAGNIIGGAGVVGNFQFPSGMPRMVDQNNAPIVPTAAQAQERNMRIEVLKARQSDLMKRILLCMASSNAASRVTPLQRLM
jgi:hypothetical protein